MNTTDAGRLGEIKVAAKLVEFGWYVFTDISGKCPVDLMAWKDNRSISVQVKTTTTAKGNSYPVQLGRLRVNTKQTVIHKFDPLGADYLGVYIEPLDKVCFVKCSTITEGRLLTFRSIPSKDGRGRVISEFEVI